MTPAAYLGSGLGEIHSTALFLAPIEKLHLICRFDTLFVEERYVHFDFCVNQHLLSPRPKQGINTWLKVSQANNTFKIENIECPSPHQEQIQTNRGKKAVRNDRCKYPDQVKRQKKEYSFFFKMGKIEVSTWVAGYF